MLPSYEDLKNLLDAAMRELAECEQQRLTLQRRIDAMTNDFYSDDEVTQVFLRPVAPGEHRYVVVANAGAVDGPKPASSERATPTVSLTKAWRLKRLWGR
jgi:hypothetical protein